MQIERVVLFFWTFTLSASAVFAASMVDCKLKAGSVIHMPADICAKEDGEAIIQSAPAPTPQTADQLFDTWEANNRTNHAEAAKAGKELLAAFPDDQRSPNVKAWVSAYDKVVASGVVPKAIDTTARETPARDSELSEATKKFILTTLTSDHNELALTPQPKRIVIRNGFIDTGNHYRVLDQKFDGCVLRSTLYVPASNEYRISEHIVKTSIWFSKMDPSTVVTRTNQDRASGGWFVSFGGEFGLNEGQYFKNTGTSETPAVGESIPFEVLYSRLIKIYGKHIISEQRNRNAGGSFDTTSPETAVRLANAVKELVRQCGGKVLTF